VLIRHGQTAANIAERLDTVAPGAGLTELGHHQAAAIPAVMAATPVDAIFVSPLIRTWQTAAPLAAARGLKVRTVAGLTEVSAGVRNGEQGADVVADYHRVIMSWPTGSAERLFGGESGPEFLARFDAALESICATGITNGVVVSHGSALRCWAAARAGDITVEDALNGVLDNTGSITIERQHGGGWRVTDWNCRALGRRRVAAGH